MKKLVLVGLAAVVVLLILRHRGGDPVASAVCPDPAQPMLGGEGTAIRGLEPPEAPGSNEARSVASAPVEPTEVSRTEFWGRVLVDGVGRRDVLIAWAGQPVERWEDPEPGVEETRSGAGGYFRLGDLSNGVHFEVDLPGHPLVHFVTGPGHGSRAEALEIAVPGYGTLRARAVAADGTALQLELSLEAYDGDGAPRASGPHTALSGYSPFEELVEEADGWTRFTDVVPGLELEIRADSEVLWGSDLAPRTRIRALAPGEHRMEEIVVPPHFDVRGLLLDELGEPVPAAEVGIRPWGAGRGFFYLGGSSRTDRTTDERGRFTFRSVPPGEYLATAPIEPAGLFAGPAFTVVDRDIDLVLRPPDGGPLRVVVIEPDGSPTSRPVEVEVESEEHGRFQLFDCPHDPKSGLELGPLYSTAHRLRVWLEGPSDWVEVPARAREVSVRMRLGASLSFEVAAGVDGIWWRHGLAPRRGFSISRTEGRCRIEGLPPGTYDIGLRASGSLTALLKGMSFTDGECLDLGVLEFQAPAQLTLLGPQGESLLVRTEDYWETTLTVDDPSLVPPGFTRVFRGEPCFGVDGNSRTWDLSLLTCVAEIVLKPGEERELDVWPGTAHEGD